MANRLRCRILSHDFVFIRHTAPDVELWRCSRCGRPRLSSVEAFVEV
jgi:hypothetical protein